MEIRTRSLIAIFEAGPDPVSDHIILDQVARTASTRASFFRDVVFPIALKVLVALALEQPVDGTGQIAGDLVHPQSVCGALLP